MFFLFKIEVGVGYFILIQTQFKQFLSINYNFSLHFSQLCKFEIKYTNISTIPINIKKSPFFGSSPFFSELNSDFIDIM